MSFFRTLIFLGIGLHAYQYDLVLAIILPEFYENYKIDVPKISSFETSSLQTCIHKCQLHNECNIVNAKQKADSKVECVFARVECFEKLEEKMRESPGWQIYKLPVKQCEARRVQEKATSSAEPENKTKCSEGGSFKIKHSASGKYLYINDFGKLVVCGGCNQKFCTNEKGYLKQFASHLCLKKNADTIISAVDCQSDEAKFFFKDNKIYYKDQTQFAVILTGEYAAEKSEVRLGDVCEEEANCKFQLQH